MDVTQKVEQLLNLDLEKNYDFWIHPYTGVLLYFKNDSKLLIYQNFTLMDKLPPDQILELPKSIISHISFGQNIFIICFTDGSIAQIDNYSYTIKYFKKHFKKYIKFSSMTPNENILLLYTDDDKLISFDITKTKEIREYKIKEGIITKFQWLTNSKFVLVTDTGSLYYFDNNTGKLVKHIKEAHKFNITSLTNHPRSLYTVVTGDSKGEVKIWNLDEQNIHPDLVNFFADQKDEITTLTCSPNGDMILVGDAAGRIRLIDSVNIRNERPLIYLPFNHPVEKIIVFNKQGEFLILNKSIESKTGSITLFQGFSLQDITLAFQNFQQEIESFKKKIDQLPEWLITNSLDDINASEIPIMERNLELALKLFSGPLLEKILVSAWLKDNFKDSFKKEIQLDENIRKNILTLQEKIAKKKESIEQSVTSHKELQEKLIQYIAGLKPGKISLDQLNLYFNTTNSEIIPILQKLESERLINAQLKSEYTGYFLEINLTKGFGADENGEVSELNIITCHNCGTDYSIEEKICPNCKAESITCESCGKFIQKRQMVINCPYCRSYFHLACFESKVKMFGRCPKCRETVDFDSLMRKSVNEQKEQDKIISGLNRLIAKKSDFIKGTEEKDSDDDLFDF